MVSAGEVQIAISAKAVEIPDMVSAGEVQIAISAKAVEIPEGYRKLSPEEIKRPDDKAWLEAGRRWINVLSPGFPVKNLTIIRKIEEEEHSKNNPEWGAW